LELNLALLLPLIGVWTVARHKQLQKVSLDAAMLWPDATVRWMLPHPSNNMIAYEWKFLGPPMHYQREHRDSYSQAVA
jgi:hypothetical protein